MDKTSWTLADAIQSRRRYLVEQALIHRPSWLQIKVATPSSANGEEKQSQTAGAVCELRLAVSKGVLILVRWRGTFNRALLQNPARLLARLNDHSWSLGSDHRAMSLGLVEVCCRVWEASKKRSDPQRNKKRNTFQWFFLYSEGWRCDGTFAHWRPTQRCESPVHTQSYRGSPHSLIRLLFYAFLPFHASFPLLSQLSHHTWRVGSRSASSNV